MVANESTTSAPSRNKHRLISVRLVALLVFAAAGFTIAVMNGTLHGNDTDRKLLALAGILLFVLTILTALHVFAKSLRRFLAYKLGAARAATIALFVRIMGYVTVAFAILGLLGIPVQSLLLGGAVTGVIIGVAAQQSLANFFAGIVLIVSRPFGVGQQITLYSGALGGEYAGTVTDMGLVYISLHRDDGSVILLPNAGVLGSAVAPPSKNKQTKKVASK